MTQAKEILLRFDWTGFILYWTGFLSFFIELLWEGTLYSWKIAQVIGMLLAGAAGLMIFIRWEILLPLKQAEPFLPLHHFKNLLHMACVSLNAIGAII